MNPGIYRQYDDRWGSLPYPGWGAYLSDSGCGCLSVYHCAIELDKYKNLTVPQCRDYMVQFATVENGTYWSGITAGLEHYGFSVHWREADTMDDIFRELSDSCKCGVILFSKPKPYSSIGPDGTLWTTIGHFIAFSDYKIENGEHKFYMKDSGPRKHDGWFSYEKSMKGCCANVWICKSTNGQKRYDPSPSPTPKPDPKPTPRPAKYTGKYPEVKKYLEPGDRGEMVTRLQNYLDWYYNGAFFKECGPADGIYGNNTLKWTNKMLTEFFGASEADGLVGPKVIAEMKKRGGATPDPTPTPRPKVYPGNYPVVKKYLEPGDRGEMVIRLQQYLDWYYNGEFFKECGGADGVYGPNTLRWANKMLTEFFGASEADGKIGPKTIAEMKKRGGASPEPAPTNYTHVIDVSGAQSDIDWAKVKAAGITGVMVRCGYRGYEYGILKEDNMFMKHIKGASAAGLKLGIYFYTQAINYKEGSEEADYAISLLNKSGVKLYYPIAIDSEYCAPEEPDDKPRANNLTKAQRTQAIKGFCDRIKARGGEAMIYANLSDLRNSMDLGQLPFDIWCAQWDVDKCQFEGNLKMWQYTSEGSINGIRGNVDRNRCYITKACPQPSPTPPKPDPKPTPGKKPYSGPYPTTAEIRTAQIGGLCQACKDQTSWSYSSYYAFEENPTIPKSKENSTCVTYVSCVFQRTGDLNSGDCLWHDGRGYGDGKVRGTKELFDVTYYNNKKSLKDLSLQTGDVLFYDDNKSGEMGNGGHEEIFNGVRNGKHSYFYSGGTGSYHNTSNSNSEPNTRKVLAVARLKTRTYLRKGDRGNAVTKLQNYLDWYFDGAFFKECGGADGIFGNNTHKWTVKMQTDFFGAKEADGSVGPKTFEKMNAVVK